MSLLLLPEDLILHLASFLVYPDIAALSKVCRTTHTILSPLRDNLPWKITIGQSKDGSFVADIKVGWFKLSSDLSMLQQLWKGQTKKKQRSFNIIRIKGIGGPFLPKILSTKEPYLELNQDGSLHDIHPHAKDGCHRGYLRIGYLHPRYCSETNILSLIMNERPFSRS